MITFAQGKNPPMEILFLLKALLFTASAGL
jgi:hypothetical protein